MTESDCGLVRDVLRGTKFKESKTMFSLFCPYHDNKVTPSAVLYKNTGIFKCFSCGVRKSLGHFLSDRGVEYSKESQPVVEKVAKREDPDLKKVGSFHTPLKEELGTLRILYEPYRLLRSEICTTGSLGGMRVSGRLLTPLPFGYECRSLVGEKPKVLYPKNMNRDYLLTPFGSSKDVTLYVTEGLKNACTLYSLGITNVASTFGAVLSAKQKNELRAYRNVVVIADGDKAGMGYITQIGMSANITSVFWRKGSDIFDLYAKGLEGGAEFQKLLTPYRVAIRQSLLGVE